MNLPAVPFTLTHLPELGLTEKALRARLASGEVWRVVRGVYAAAALENTIETHVAATALVLRADQILIDRSAAWLHGVDAYSPVEREAGPRVETCVLPEDHRTQRTDVSGHRRDLASEDITLVHGLRVTTPLRTALDLGCHLRRREAFAAMCALARVHGVTASAAIASLPRFAGRRGVVQLRQLAPLLDPRFESPREAWTFLAIHDAGLPHPEPQVWFEIDGIPTYRVDLAYRLARVCVEYDGHDAHEATAEQREHDRRRRAWLHDHGWRVIAVRSGDFTGAALDRWISELRQALATPYSSRRW